MSNASGINGSDPTSPGLGRKHPTTQTSHVSKNSSDQQVSNIGTTVITQLVVVQPTTPPRRRSKTEEESTLKKMAEAATKMPRGNSFYNSPMSLQRIKSEELRPIKSFSLTEEHTKKTSFTIKGHIDLGFKPYIPSQKTTESIIFIDFTKITTPQSNFKDWKEHFLGLLKLSAEKEPKANPAKILAHHMEKALEQTAYYNRLNEAYELLQESHELQKFLVQFKTIKNPSSFMQKFKKLPDEYKKLLKEVIGEMEILDWLNSEEEKKGFKDLILESQLKEDYDKLKNLEGYVNQENDWEKDLFQKIEELIPLNLKEEPEKLIEHAIDLFFQGTLRMRLVAAEKEWGKEYSFLRPFLKYHHAKAFCDYFNSKLNDKEKKLFSAVIKPEVLTALIDPTNIANWTKYVRVKKRELIEEQLKNLNNRIIDEKTWTNDIYFRIVVDLVSQKKEEGENSLTAILDLSFKETSILPRINESMHKFPLELSFLQEFSQAKSLSQWRKLLTETHLDEWQFKILYQLIGCSEFFQRLLLSDTEKFEKFALDSKTQIETFRHATDKALQLKNLCQDLIEKSKKEIIEPTTPWTAIAIQDLIFSFRKYFNNHSLIASDILLNGKPLVIKDVSELKSENAQECFWVSFLSTLLEETGHDPCQAYEYNKKLVDGSNLSKNENVQDCIKDISILPLLRPLMMNAFSYADQLFRQLFFAFNINVTQNIKTTTLSYKEKKTWIKAQPETGNFEVTTTKIYSFYSGITSDAKVHVDVEVQLTIAGSWKEKIQSQTKLFEIKNLKILTEDVEILTEMMQLMHLCQLNSIQE